MADELRSGREPLRQDRTLQRLGGVELLRDLRVGRRQLIGRPLQLGRALGDQPVQLALTAQQLDRHALKDLGQATKLVATFQQRPKRLRIELPLLNRLAASVRRRIGIDRWRAVKVIAPRPNTESPALSARA